MTAPDNDYVRFAMFNGSVVASDSLRVSPLGSGFMFGEGLFETVRVQNSRPMLFDDHYARLAAAMGCFGAGPTSSRGELHDRCSKVIAANSLVNGSLKIVVFKEASGWAEMILARAATYAAARYETGFRLKTVACDLRIDPLHALKSLNYLPNVQAKRNALAAGFDEAVFFDPHRHVLEGATTNVFIVKDRVVSTPPLQSGILPGVMRGSTGHPRMRCQARRVAAGRRGVRHERPPRYHGGGPSRCDHLRSRRERDHPLVDGSARGSTRRDSSRGQQRGCGGKRRAQGQVELPVQHAFCVAQHFTPPQSPRIQKLPVKHHDQPRLRLVGIAQRATFLRPARKRLLRKIERIVAIARKAERKPVEGIIPAIDQPLENGGIHLLF